MTPFEQRFPRLWHALDRISLLVVGSLLFYLFSALIITIPAAVVGLFAAVGGLIRPVQGEPAGRFWRGFRRSFGTSLLLGLLSLAMGVLLYSYIRFFWSMGTTFGQVAAFFFGSVAAAAVMVSQIAWPLLAWFPQPLGKLLKRSLMLTMAHPLLGAGGLLGLLVLPLLFLLLPPQINGLVIFLGPGLLALVAGLAAWQVMKRYAGPEDEFAE